MLYIHHLEHTGEVWNQFGPQGTPGERLHDLEKTSPNRRKMTKNAKSHMAAHDPYRISHVYNLYQVLASHDGCMCNVGQCPPGVCIALNRF